MIFDPFIPIEEMYVARRPLDPDESRDFDNQLVKVMVEVRKAYSSDRRPPLKSRLERLAYVVQHVPIGMRATYELMQSLGRRRLPPQWSVLWDEPLHMVSLGAGPGTDFFGVLAALSGLPVGLDLTQIDERKHWSTFFRAFRKSFAQQVPSMARVVLGGEHRFVQADFTKPNLGGSACVRALQNADLIVLNRVLSGLARTSQRALLRAVARVAQDDSLLAVVDIDRSNCRDVIAAAEELCKSTRADSKWIVPFRPRAVSHFGWTIPKRIMRLGEAGGQSITRSGRFIGGVIHLRD